MAVKPYWWCPACSTTHDSAVAKCVQCGASGLTKKQARVASAVGTVDAPLNVSWTPPVPLNAEEQALGEIGSGNVRVERLDMREFGAGIAAKIDPPTSQRRLQTSCWGPYDIWDSLEDA